MCLSARQPLRTHAIAATLATLQQSVLVSRNWIAESSDDCSIMFGPAGVSRGPHSLAARLKWKEEPTLPGVPGEAAVWGEGCPACLDRPLAAS